MERQNHSSIFQREFSGRFVGIDRKKRGIQKTSNPYKCIINLNLIIMAKKVKETVEKSVSTAKKARVAKEASMYDPKATEKAAERARRKSSAKVAFDSNLLNPEIMQQITDAKAELDELTKSVKEAHDIDIQATKLADIVNAFNATQEELDREAELAKKERQESLQSVVNQYEEEIGKKKLELQQAIASIKEEIRIAREDMKKVWDREVEEYEYSKKISRERDNDSWEEEKAAREGAINELEESLKQRESLVASREDKMFDIEEQLKEAKERAENAFQDGKKEGKEEADRSNAFETRYLKKEHEGQIKEKEMEISQLRSQLESAKAQIEKIQTSLDNANQQNHDLMIEVAKNAGKTTIVGAGDNSTTSRK